MKRDLTTLEPWKAMAAAFRAGAAVFGAIFGLIGSDLGYFHGRR